MKPVDKIEQLKVSTYYLHKQEDGIPDMTIGLVLLVLGLNNPFPLIMLVTSYYILVSMLKKKLIYPRVGIAVFSQNAQQSRILRIVILVTFVTIGMVVANMFDTARQASGSIHPLLYVFGIFVSGLFIWGGITQKHLYYVAGLCLALPIIGEWTNNHYMFHMPMAFVVILVFMSSIQWLLWFKNPIVDKQAARRPNLVIHNSLVGFGVLGIALILLSAYNPGQAIIIKNWAIKHPGVILAYVIAFVSLGYGIAFKAVRFMLYAVLISMGVIISEVYVKNIPGVIPSVLGSLIIATGALLFKRFLKRYPILEEKQDESAEI